MPEKGAGESEKGCEKGAAEKGARKVPPSFPALFPRKARKVPPSLLVPLYYRQDAAALLVFWHAGKEE